MNKIYITNLTMSKYSIKDLENLSGIKAHTLRIWEQRHKIINPKRTPTNIRYYDSNDLKLILNIARLKENGFKISKIASMPREEMHQIIMQLTDNQPNDFQSHLHQLTNAMIDLDEALFEHTLSSCILQLGFESTMRHVIYPFLVKIGFLWQAEAIHPAQEHFITCLIRQKLIVAIDGQRLINEGQTKKFMLFLPENELHEINLLFAHFLLKKYGNKTVYLGQSLPFKDVEMAYELHRPDYLLTSITSAPKSKHIQDFLNKLGTAFPDIEILIGGTALAKGSYKMPDNLTALYTIDDLYAYCQLPHSIDKQILA